jgi:calcium uptake protein 1, mitochondrial
VNIFFLLKKAPTRHFEIAFKMMDLDGSGNVDIDEFEQLQLIIRNNTQMGKKHRDTRMTGSVVKENSALINYFFGNNKKDLLTVEKFVAFQKSLQKEMIRIEVLEKFYLVILI